MRKKREQLKRRIQKVAGTLTDFAMTIGMNFHRLSRFVSGSIEIRPEEHDAIANGLGISKRQYNRLKNK